MHVCECLQLNGRHTSNSMALLFIAATSKIVSVYMGHSLKRDANCKKVKLVMLLLFKMQSLF